jgi:hypothetical protein
MTTQSEKIARNLELRDEIILILLASLIPLTTLSSMVF